MCLPIFKIEKMEKVSLSYSVLVKNYGKTEGLVFLFRCVFSLPSFVLNISIEKQ